MNNINCGNCKLWDPINPDNPYNGICKWEWKYSNIPNSISANLNFDFVQAYELMMNKYEGSNCPAFVRNI